VATEAHPQGLTERPTGSGSVDIRVVARTGILPEITRQTYESLAKALREAVMNAIDAGASEVHIDLSFAGEGVLRVVDDGNGMTVDDLREHFFTLGGSARADDGEKFGRIGIGSLALLGFGDAVRIRSQGRDGPGVEAVVSMPPGGGGLDPLAETNIGWAHETSEIERPPILSRRSETFTEVCVEGLGHSVLDEVGNVGSYYALVEALRRLLPLPLPPGGHDLLDALTTEQDAISTGVREIAGEWSVDVFLHGPWHEPTVLYRRVYGENASAEPWVGDLHPISLVLPSTQDEPIRLLGYLVALPRANGDWAGVTARVQNVAVTVGTFFGLESDPGFLRYVTGELHISGGFDKRSLVRIDRSSFNETADDFRGIQQAMRDEIYRFKIAGPQRFQRRKSEARAHCRQARDVATGLCEIEAALAEIAVPGRTSHGLPSRLPKGWKSAPDASVVGRLTAMGLRVSILGDNDADVSLMPGGRDEVALPRILACPTVEILGVLYDLRLVHLGCDAPPLAVSNSPRRLMVNVDHAMVAERGVPDSVRVLIALDVAEQVDNPDDQIECLRGILGAT
jgi:hypothetical protein